MALLVTPDRQYTAPAGADAVAITPAGTAWANSAYVQLLAATPVACVLTGVTVYTAHGSSDATAYDFEVDIATGVAAAEVVIATVRGFNRLIFTSGQSGHSQYIGLRIPIDNIAAGARLSTRLRKNDTNTSNLWKVAVTFFQKPLTTTTLLTAVAQKTLPPAAASVTVTAGSPAWAGGAWVQLRAASGAALVITGLVAGNPSSSEEMELDLGTGGAGSEVIITTLRLFSSTQGFPSHLMLPNPLDNIAASTRVAARLRSATASTTVQVSLMVLDKPL